MKKRTAFVCVTAMVLLAACSKSTPPPESTGAPAAAAPSSAPAATPEPAIDRVKLAAGMQSLISPSPKCDEFRAELTEAGKTAGSPGASDLSQIVAKAHQAGCTTAPQQP